MRYRCKGKYEETLMSELKMGDVMKKLLYLEEHISCKDYSPDILVGFKHRIVREESGAPIRAYNNYLCGRRLGKCSLKNLSPLTYLKGKPDRECSMSE